MDKYYAQTNSFIDAVSEENSIDANLYLGRMVALSNLLLMNGVDVSAIPIGAAPLEKMDGSEEKYYPSGTLGLVSSDYSDVVTTKLSRADEFVKILGNDGIEYYGGNQDWYRKYTQISGGCGPVAASNIVAYFALYKNDAEKLFKNDTNVVKQSDYVKLMNIMYKYVNPNEVPVLNVISDIRKDDIRFGKMRIPGTTGVWPLSKFANGVVKYADKMGVELEANIYENNDISLEDAVNKIKESLKSDSPVALFNGFDAVPMKYVDPKTDKTLNTNFALHWVTITSIIENKSSGEVTAHVSTWGGEASLSLTELWSKKDKVSPGIVYFDVKK